MAQIATLEEAKAGVQQFLKTWAFMTFAVFFFGYGVFGRVVAFRLSLVAFFGFFLAVAWIQWRKTVNHPHDERDPYHPYHRDPHHHHYADDRYASRYDERSSRYPAHDRYGTTSDYDRRYPPHDRFAEDRRVSDDHYGERAAGPVRHTPPRTAASRTTSSAFGRGPTSSSSSGWRSGTTTTTSRAAAPARTGGYSSRFDDQPVGGSRVTGRSPAPAPQRPNTRFDSPPPRHATGHPRSDSPAPCAGGFRDDPFAAPSMPEIRLRNTRHAVNGAVKALFFPDRVDGRERAEVFAALDDEESRLFYSDRGPGGHAPPAHFLGQVDEQKRLRAIYRYTGEPHSTLEHVWGFTDRNLTIAGIMAARSPSGTGARHYRFTTATNSLQEIHSRNGLFPQDAEFFMLPRSSGATASTRPPLGPATTHRGTPNARAPLSSTCTNRFTSKPSSVADKPITGAAARHRAAAAAGPRQLQREAEAATGGSVQVKERRGGTALEFTF